MKIGDIVIITESFGGGLPYIGAIGTLEKRGEWVDRGILYSYEVRVASRDSRFERFQHILCNCTPATGLVKALV